MTIDKAERISLLNETPQAILTREGEDIVGIRRCVPNFIHFETHRWRAANNPHSFQLSRYHYHSFNQLKKLCEFEQARYHNHCGLNLINRSKGVFEPVGSSIFWCLYTTTTPTSLHRYSPDRFSLRLRKFPRGRKTEAGR